MSGEYKSCVIAGRTVAELPFGMDEEHPDCIALKLCLSNKIAELNADGVKEFYVNAEYGVGLFAGEVIAVLRDTLGIKLNIVMPHEYQANRYSPEIRDRFFSLHESADEFKLLSTMEHEGCYHDADMYMVDYSDILLTDDENSFIARYAVKEGVEVEMIGRLLLGVL